MCLNRGAPTWGLPVAGLRALLVGALIACVLAPVALAKPSSYYAADRALVKEYAKIEAGKLPGVVLPGGPASFISVKENPASLIIDPDSNHEPADGTTACVDASGQLIGPAAHCTIELSVLPHTDGGLRATVAHEVFHVFQFVMAGSLANFYRPPEKNWLIEGSATWVEAELVKYAPGAHEWWLRYLGSPDTALFARTYSAVGFFGHLAASGISPWARFKAMFAAESSAAAYEAAVGGNKVFLNSEASVFFREPAFGPAWDQKGPAVPSKAEVDYKPAKLEPEEAESSRPVIAHADEPDVLSLKKMTLAKPVLEIKVLSGYLRLHSTRGPSLDEVEPKKLLLCSHPGHCDCPSEPEEKPLELRRGRPRDQRRLYRR